MVIPAPKDAGIIPDATILVLETADADSVAVAVLKVSKAFVLCSFCTTKSIAVPVIAVSSGDRTVILIGMSAPLYCLLSVRLGTTANPLLKSTARAETEE